MSEHRTMPGVPEGGQFAVTPKGEPEVTLGLSVDEDAPQELTPQHIAHDLSMSNEVAMSWFQYRTADEGLKVDLFDDEGQVVKTFTARLDITQDTETFVVGNVDEDYPAGLSTDEGAPDAPELGHIASDLSYSNEDSMSWFNYRLQGGALKADLFDDEGRVAKTYTVGVDITEDLPS